MLRSEGLEPVLWTRHARDWSRRTTAASIVADLTRRLAPGEVLLLHDADHYGAPGAWRTTVAALPGVLGELGRRGLRAVAA